MKKLILLALFSICSLVSTAQDVIIKPQFIQNPMDSVTRISFNASLDSFFASIEKGKINENLLTLSNIELTKSKLQELVNYELNKDSVVAKQQDKQLTNLYPVSEDSYSLSISYIQQRDESNPILFYIINLIATKTENGFTFSIPLGHLTKNWKTKTVGNITYHYRNELNEERAKLFNEKNTSTASKFNLQAEKLDFYMVENYQDILKLLGYEYSVYSNGQYRDGYGVVAKTIFSVMNNEDFSHDIFHYYSGQINERANRNWITEEGIAYLWGNAYYTDKEGEMIIQERLVKELQNYLSQKPETDLFQLFEKNTKIFNQIAPEISVRSTISGLIAQEIEKKKGMDGVLKLINAGRKDRVTNYLRVTNELIGINKENFNATVKELVLNIK